MFMVPGVASAARAVTGTMSLRTMSSSPHPVSVGSVSIGQPGLDRNAVAHVLARIAGKAGAVLRTFAGPRCPKQTKPDGSPVTAADVASQALILEELAAAFPQWPVVSEEQAEHAERKRGATFFLVDPLDGTRAFLAGGTDYCVLIALIANGAPIAAAIHAPACGKTWWAGEDAFVSPNAALEPVRKLAALPARDQPPIAIVSSVHAGEASRGLCKKMGIADVRCENSALKFARLAEGEADIYPRIGRTMQWDVAAGDALLRALGGGVFGFDGRPLAYGAHDGDWANPDFIATRLPPERMI